MQAFKTPQTPDGSVIAARPLDAGELEIDILIPISTEFGAMTRGREKELVFAARSRLARLGIEVVPTTSIDVDGARTTAVTMRVGNPQCVVLGEVSEERLHSLASHLAVHPRFPEGTNVELATVEDPGRVRILIWERGVGPTEASGTGACAAAVAAMLFGGASRDVDVVSPGGSQRVEWRDEGLFLTGWAELIAACDWGFGA